jgi:hypothetical protein
MTLLAILVIAATSVAYAADFRHLAVYKFSRNLSRIRAIKTGENEGEVCRLAARGIKALAKIRRRADSVGANVRLVMSGIVADRNLS